jgi:hypothetical protein
MREEIFAWRPAPSFLFTRWLYYLIWIYHLKKKGWSYDINKNGCGDVRTAWPPVTSILLY